MLGEILLDNNGKYFMGKEKIAMSDKRYYIMYNVGTTKYLVNYHDGIQKHKDGSDFFGMKSFKNKKTMNNFISELLNQGYRERRWLE